jgi:hypothetical protein
MITAFGVLIFPRDERRGLLLNTRTMPSALHHSSVPKDVCCRMNKSTEELKRRVWFIRVDFIYTEFSGVLNICRLLAPERGKTPSSSHLLILGTVLYVGSTLAVIACLGALAQRNERFQAL